MNDMASFIKYSVFFLLVIIADMTQGQMMPLHEKYSRLPVGSIKPSGWLRTQMKSDMEGFVGNLDRLVPTLMNDSIYGSGRLKKHSKAKDLGNLKAGDAAGDEQYKWWNSETQSNWWDGFVRNAILLDDHQALEKIKNYINGVLKTQDEDGYLGIYDDELRYKFVSENGELWAKSTLLRGLLAYYDYSNDTALLNSIIKAVENVMTNYPLNSSNPFFAGTDFAGGVAHGLTFTDILDRLYQITGDRRYPVYAAFLYDNFSRNFSSEKDAQLPNILDKDFKLQSHGVHTYEHLRPLIVSAYATGRPDLIQAMDIYLSRIRSCTTQSGGPIGDEWIAGRKADATMTGYEYCSIHELLDSYSVLFQKSGDLKAANDIENIFFNAAQGSRNPDHSCIAYLKTDNSYEMEGSKNGMKEGEHPQTRYKYSPVHQDVAVCCVPNAGRITPYFIQTCWLKEGEDTLVAPLIAPCNVTSSINGHPVSIEESTEYPYSNRVVFKIKSESEYSFKLKIRRPQWATSVESNKPFKSEEGFLIFNYDSVSDSVIELEFKTEVRVVEDSNQEKYFRYGALLYALPIESIEFIGRVYAYNFHDYGYKAKDLKQYNYYANHKAMFKDGMIIAKLRNHDNQKIEEVTLIPIGKTILRQASFKMESDKTN